LCLRLVVPSSNFACHIQLIILTYATKVDLTWELLMKPQYKELQQCIFRSEEELKRFRAAIVNAVMATDIFEKDGKAFRNQRWDKAFHSTDAQEGRAGCDEEAINLKATIVIEHIIQASDVSHTMQHYNVYRKWVRLTRWRAWLTFK
jgi:3'5'-cyclic nucleotide phosphodiesterase